MLIRKKKVKVDDSNGGNTQTEEEKLEFGDGILSKEHQEDYYHFFMEECESNPAYEIRLYKVPDKMAPNKSLELLDVFTGQVPKPYDIGETHGSAVYKALGSAPGERQPDTRTINLSNPIWDKRKKAKEMEGLSVGNEGGGFEFGINLAERIVELAAKINGGGSDMTGKSLTGAFKRVTDLQVGVLETAVKERISLHNEFKKILSGSMTAELEKVQADAEQSQISEGWEQFWDHPLVKEASDWVTEWGKKLLGATEAKQQEGVEAIYKDKTFQELFKDKDKIVAFYKNCCNNPKIGKEAMDALFKLIGLQIDEELQPEGEKK